MWIDINGEYHKQEYWYCRNCQSYYDNLGCSLKDKGINNEEDLILWARGGKSNTSIGIDK
jgi:hypothetical protein